MSNNRDGKAMARELRDYLNDAYSAELVVASGDDRADLIAARRNHTQDEVIIAISPSPAGVTPPVLELTVYTSPAWYNRRDPFTSLEFPEVFEAARFIGRLIPYRGEF